MVYLIGVEHRVQSIARDSSETADQTKYGECLEQAIHSYNIALVAEEYSEDSLTRAQFSNPSVVQEFFTERIAIRAGVKHMLCEPKLKSRFQMGCQGRERWSELLAELGDTVSDDELDPLGIALEINKEWPIREKYWLDQLKPVIKSEIIFVCGDGHIETFADLLNSQGIPSAVVNRRIGMTPELIQQANSEIQYAKRNRAQVERYYQELLKKHGGTIPNHPLLSILERSESQ